MQRTDDGGRRAELLAIAAQQFAKRGYAGTSVRHIAEAAGILSGSLYHHFASKEAIFIEILRELIDDSVRRYEQAVAAGGGPLAVMESLVRQAFAIIHERRHAVLVYQNERAFLQAQPRFAFVVLGSARMEQIWLEQMRLAQAEGVVRPDVDVVVTNRFIRDAVWSSVRWFTPDGGDTVERVSHEFIAFFLGGILMPEAARQSVER